ncbi:MAG TPA: DMT family transporter [Acidimicrobiales bacterium]|nr:DMT family transporter [Acidimicrobiales bacterium]
MKIEIPLALAASAFTASASVMLRAAAAPAPGELRFSWRLVTFLLHRPLWFVGVLSMIGGFALQVAALHSGELTIVQPVISSELLFVFAYLALRHRARVRGRDWAAAAGVAASLGGFLYVANPTGGSPTSAGLVEWSEAAGAIALSIALAIALSGVRGRDGRAPSPARKAAFLAISAGLAWAFVAAVVKELSVHLSQGPAGVFENWSPYVLVVAGAIGMFLVSNAFQAGPLAASQPGLTIVEPLVASLLGITIFGEHLRSGAAQLAAEAVLLAVLVGSVVVLSRSPIVATDDARTSRSRIVESVLPADEPAGWTPGADSVGRDTPVEAATERGGSGGS